MRVVSDSITLKSCFLDVTLTIATECQCFCFVLFFGSFTFFTNLTSVLGKTLGFSVKPQSSITLVILPRGEDPEQLLSATKIVIPK